MKLTLDRFAKKDKYTIGRLSIDGKYFCDTIEDTDRGLTNQMSTSEILSKKVKSLTAIPSGTYTITMKVKSPSFSQKEYYKNFCDGYLPRLKNVPGYEGVLIHIGNTEKDSAGCIIVGKNTVVGKVTNSKITFEALYAKLKEASNNNEEITITIK